ncbi:MAG: hypothetical protein PHH40_02365 [Candidatus Moranbacteria bacterium]|nr:hypothetical protein [Candidatus Moranbacteria bacterium]MDD3965399.1 hypothetical protein [Candidatus Moranbacteria bacterium]
MIKILLLPFFLLLSVIVAILYIKPSFDDILTKRDAIASVDEKLAIASAVSSNITRFDQLIDQEKETEDFFFQYLPLKMDQEQFIDAFSFLATQRGLYISDMKVEVVAKDATLEEDSLPVDDTSVAPKTVFQPKKISFTGSANGSYENIKTFFALMNHMNRYQEMQFFSIEEEKKESTSPEVASGNLKGTFSVVYGFLPKKTVSSALDMPLFTNGELKLAEISTLKSLITDIPALQKTPSGKPNPFQ